MESAKTKRRKRGLRQNNPTSTCHCWRLVPVSSSDAFGTLSYSASRFFGSQRADRFARLPHFGIANSVEFLGQLLLVIRLAASGQNARAFLAGFHTLIQVSEHRHNGLLETRSPIERAPLGG